jgi:hypothetical protein
MKNNQKILVTQQLWFSAVFTPTPKDMRLVCLTVYVCISMHVSNREINMFDEAGANTDDLKIK